MKLCICFGLAVVVALVSAETCPKGDVQTECSHMQCSTNFHKECVQGVCTCTADAVRCVTRDECQQNSGDCNRNGGWHCVDNRCRCGGFFG